jgi:integrase
VATVLKRCGCPEPDWRTCPHAWVVRYRTLGGRASRQQERSFGTSRREADDFALKVEHDKRASVFIDPAAGDVLFRGYAETWLSRHTGADSTVAGYRSVLRAHVNPAFGNRPLSRVRREDIKNLIAVMRGKGLGASRVREAHLVVAAIFNEAVRDKMIAVSPCVRISLPEVTVNRDFIAPTALQMDTLAAGLPGDWAATIWLMHGCGLRVGEALAISERCIIADGTVLRVFEQVNPQGRLRPLKFRAAGDYRDTPLPRYVSDAVAKHLADYGTTEDGYLFAGRRQKLVVRRTYQDDFARAARKAALPPQFIPHSLRHHFASTALARGIPITDVSQWLGHRSIEVTYRIYRHLMPSAWDRARTALDQAYLEATSCSRPNIAAREADGAARPP